MKKPDSEADVRNGLNRRRFFNTVAAGAAEVAILTVPGQGEAAAETAPCATGEMVRVVFQVNGAEQKLDVDPRWTLQYVLRERLGLTATKDGCERGECGACTVLIDGVSRYSCMTLAVESAGTQVTTVEGLMHGKQLGAVQQAFVEEDAMQCGFCTSGQVMSVEALLRKTPQPNFETIREGVSGNLCRCGAYNHIFRAAQRAAELKKARS